MLGNMPNWMFFGMPFMDMNNMNMNNMNMNNINMNNMMMPGMNMGGNEFWSMIYGTGSNFQQNNQQQQFSPDKVNVVFKTTAGLKTNVSVNLGTSIKNTIQTYLNRVGKPELFDINSGIFFLCNARRINIYDETKIENFLGGQINPIIMVNDVKNLIGASQLNL